MHSTNTADARVTKLLTLAASCFALGLRGEATAAVTAAQVHADRAGVDLHELCDEPRFLAVDLSVLVPWTEEPAPSGVGFDGCAVAPITLADGSTLVIMTAPEGVWIERIADEARGYRMLGRGFWRDCDAQEAVYLACDAWGLL